MGNCVRRESATQWGGDDWSFSPVRDSPANTRKHRLRKTPENRGLSSFQTDQGRGEENLLIGQKEEKQQLGLGLGGLASSEVKIKISKKQLEELLGNVEYIKEISVQQVLARLVAVSHEFEAHQRSWRPNLQSIPE